MIPEWPEDLPCPSRVGYSLSFGDGRIKKEAEGGPPGYRRRYSLTPKTATMTVVMTRDQYALFEAFFDETLKAGSLPFTMVDVLKDGVPALDEFDVPILDGEGNPVLIAATNLCLFGDGLPQVVAMSRRVKVTFSLVQMP